MRSGQVFPHTPYPLLAHRSGPSHAQCLPDPDPQDLRDGFEFLEEELPAHQSNSAPVDPQVRAASASGPWREGWDRVGPKAKFKFSFRPIHSSLVSHLL